MRKSPILLALALAAALPATGCLSMSHDDYFGEASDLPTPEKDGWVASEPFRCEDFPVLWETAKHQACKGSREWRIDDDATTFKARRIITAWRVDLAISRGMGKRRRRFVDFEEKKDSKDTWVVRVCTVVQKNVDIDSPFNPMSAKWRVDEPDVDDAEQVAYMIAAQFRELGPSKEFERK